MGKPNFLDTKGSCFLCLNDKFTPREVARMVEVSLRSICRYLNIDQRSLLRKACQKPADIFEECEGRTCDLSVKLCQSCASLTKYLSDLISQMNLIQILITNQLQAFLQLVSFPYPPKGNSKRRQSKSFQRYRLEESAEIKAVVETLRKEAAQKCAAKVTSLMVTCFPKVRLDKLNDEDIQRLLHKKIGGPNQQEVSVPTSESGPQEEPTLTPSTPLSSVFHDLPILTPKISLGKENIKENILPCTRTAPAPPDSNDINLLPFEEPLNEQQVIYDICSRHFTTTESGYLCSICNATITNQKDISRIRQHIINCHPETVFVRPSTSPLSEERFHDHCRRFFFEESHLARQRQQLSATGSSTKTGKSRFKCEYCSRCYSEGRDFRFHLVLAHYACVEEKLAKFDGSKSTLETLDLKAPPPPVLSEVNVPSKRSRGTTSSKRKALWRCKAREGGCDKRFFTRWRFLQHKEKCGRGKAPTILKLEPLAEAQKVIDDLGVGRKRKRRCSKNGYELWKCDACENDFLNEAILIRHQKGNCSAKRGKLAFQFDGHEVKPEVDMGM